MTDNERNATMSHSMDDMEHGMRVRPAWIAGAVLGALLAGALIWLFASEQGQDLRRESARRGRKMGKQSRKALESALDRSHKELADLRAQGRHRVGDLKHQAKVLRKKADVAELQKQLAHLR